MKTSSGHNESCSNCKQRIYEMLVVIFGEDSVHTQYNMNFSSRVNDMESHPFNSALSNIFERLQEYRDHKDFVRVKKMPNVDYFIKDQFIVEFDESQHFTIPRKIALELYPKELKVGFDQEKWQRLCLELNKKDNDPAYRDEQRAWYDTLRDFVSAYKGLKPTVRLYASDHEWCKLDSRKKEDIDYFKEILNL